MKEIYTEIEINASSSTVWDILTDFDKFPRWKKKKKNISGDKPRAVDIIDDCRFINASKLVS